MCVCVFFFRFSTYDFFTNIFYLTICNMLSIDFAKYMKSSHFKPLHTHKVSEFPEGQVPSSGIKMNYMNFHIFNFRLH